MKQERERRYLIYAIGVVLLALGIVLNTKTELGVSPIISVPYVISQICPIPFAFATFLIYAFFVGLQLLIKGKKRQWQDLLQLPFSLVFSLLLNVFDAGYEWLATFYGWQFTAIWQNLLFLLMAVVITGVGAALMVNMCLIPNPADGLAKAVGDVFGKDMGFGKNVIDLLNVALTCIIGLCVLGRLSGVGLGTIIAMVGVGRAIALFNHFYRDKILLCAGLSPRCRMEATGA